MFNRVVWIAGLLAAIVLLVMLNLTTPTQIGPFGVLLFFLMIYLIALALVAGVAVVIRKILGKKKELTRKESLYEVVIAIAPLMLLLMGSLGILGWQMIGLVVIFEIIMCFLVSKRM